MEGVDDNVNLLELLNEEQMMLWKEAYDIFDKRGSGIKLLHFERMLRSLGFNPAEADVQKMMLEIQCEGRTSMAFPEFLYKIALTLMRKRNDDELSYAFKLINQDGDGYIKAKELKFIMNNLGQLPTENDLNEMIAEADSDGDGKVNFEEFCGLFNR